MIHICTTYWDPRKRCSGPLEFSAAKYGGGVNNFGWNQGFDGFLKTKLIPLRRHLEGVKSELVMFLDGNDTILTSHPDEIVSTWKKISGGRITIGSELVVWPYPELEKAQVALAGESKSPYKFVDTGLMIGKTRDLKKILDTVIASVDGYRTSMPNVGTKIIEDDVGLFVLNMIDRKIDVAIDYNCEIIAPLKNTKPEDYSIHNGKLALYLTGSTPHIVHCNGHRCVDKRRMACLSKQLVGFKKTKGQKYEQR